jgi:hypothetical protein
LEGIWIEGKRGREGKTFLLFDWREIKGGKGRWRE